jgi:hypothetical protein
MEEENVSCVNNATTYKRLTTSLFLGGSNLVSHNVTPTIPRARIVHGIHRKWAVGADGGVPDGVRGNERYPDHNKPFEVCTDASDYQMGAAIVRGAIGSLLE